mmetsp:Transcript_16035/g.24626  ORF Transcript_16035/g.24626 Transcript_16035/m.24626 type:complete len:223 (-) Transcript_16035:238-906(-)
MMNIECAIRHCQIVHTVLVFRIRHLLDLVPMHHTHDRDPKYHQIHGHLPVVASNTSRHSLTDRQQHRPRQQNHEIECNKILQLRADMQRIVEIGKLAQHIRSKHEQRNKEHKNEPLRDAGRRQKRFEYDVNGAQTQPHNRCQTNEKFVIAISVNVGQEEILLFFVYKFAPFLGDGRLVVIGLKIEQIDANHDHHIHRHQRRDVEETNAFSQDDTISVQTENR